MLRFVTDMSRGGMRRPHGMEEGPVASDPGATARRTAWKKGPDLLRTRGPKMAFSLSSSLEQRNRRSAFCAPVFVGISWEPDNG
jgi:hypothetical protein